MFVFDNSSISRLKHFFPVVFKSVWVDLDRLVSQGELISTREVWNEVQNGSPDEHLISWLNDRKNLIFKTPTQHEMDFVSKIFQVKQFRELVGKNQILRGMPVADPFLIACAMHYHGTVVTEERFKDKAAKIPNVCDYYDIPYMSLEDFMIHLKWRF